MISFVDQTKHFLKKKLEHDKFFIETRACEASTERIQSFKRLTILGNPGCGKTDLASHLVFDLLSEPETEYVARKVSTPEELSANMKPNQKHNEIIFVDDIFGRSAVDRDQTDHWLKKFKMIQELIENQQGLERCVYLIVTCRKQVFGAVEKGLKRKHPLFDSRYIVDLSHERWDLTTREKREIFYKKVEESQHQSQRHSQPIAPPKLSQEEMDEICESSPPTGFPFCARLFAMTPKYHPFKTEFFNQPVEYLLRNIKEMIRKDKRNEDIFLLILFNDIEVVSTKAFSGTTRITQGSIQSAPESLALDDFDYCQSLFQRRNIKFKYNSDEFTELLQLIDDLEENLFIVSKDECHLNFFHERIAEAVKIHFATRHFDKAMAMMDINTLLDSVRLQRSESRDEAIVVDRGDERKVKMLIERMLQEIMKGNVRAMCTHVLWEDMGFVESFEEVLLSSDRESEDPPNEYLFKFLSSEDEYDGTTLLDNALYMAPLPFRDICLQLADMIVSIETHRKTTGSSIEEDQNGARQQQKKKSELISRALISASSNSRNIDVVQKLLKMGSDKNYCRACHEIAVTSAGEKAKGDRNCHVCPLESAALAGNTEIIRVLLKERAMIPHNNWKGWEFLWCAASAELQCICTPTFIFCLEQFDSTAETANAKSNIDANESSNIKGSFIAKFQDKITFDSNEVAFPEISHLLNSYTKEDKKLLYVLIQKLDISEELMQTFDQFGFNLSEEYLQDIFSVTMREIDDAEIRRGKTTQLMNTQRFSPDFRDGLGRTPLMSEMMHPNCCLENVKALIERNADVGAKDVYSRTTIHYLVQSALKDVHILEILRMFEERGFELNLTERDNATGKTILELCLFQIGDTAENNRKETLKYLRGSSWYDRGDCSKHFLPFHILLESRSLDPSEKLNILDYLLANPQFSSIDTVDAKQNTPLLLALKHETTLNPALIEKLICSSSRFDARDCEGKTCLHYIVSSLQAERYLYCILTKCQKRPSLDCNIIDKEGNTALMIYIKGDHPRYELIDCMLKLGAKLDVGGLVHEAFIADFSKLNATESRDSTDYGDRYEAQEDTFISGEIFRQPSLGSTDSAPDSNSIGNKSEEKLASRFNILKYLINEISEPNAKDEQSRNFLHYCVMSPLRDDQTRTLCECLLERNVDIQGKDDSCKRTPVEYALMNSSFKPRTAQLMIEKCVALPYAKVHNTIVSLAKMGKISASTLEALFNKNMLGKDIKDKENLFHKLASIGYRTDSSAVDKRIFSVLNYAFSINHRNANGDTPLHTACRKKTTPRCIRNFLENGAESMAKTKEEDTCIHLLIRSDRGETELSSTLKLFTLDEETINETNKYGVSAFSEAVQQSNRFSIVSHFIKLGADVNHKDREGKTAIRHCLSSEQRDYDAHKVLFECLKSENACDMNIKDNGEKSYLNCAAGVETHSRILCITTILGRMECTKGKQLNDTDKHDRSPIHNAVRALGHGEQNTLGRDHPLIDLELSVRIGLLVVHKIACEAKDGENKEPIDYCKSENKTMIVNKLLDSSPTQQDRLVDLLEQQLQSVYTTCSSQIPILRPTIVLDYNGRVLTQRFKDFLEKAASVLSSLDFAQILDQDDSEFASDMCDELHIVTSSTGPEMHVPEQTNLSEEKDNMPETRSSEANLNRGNILIKEQDAVAKALDQRIPDERDDD